MEDTDLLVRLENIDCLELLKTIKDNTIDLVLIDPPYEVSRKTNFRAGKAKNKDLDKLRISMDFGGWDYHFSHMEEVIRECYRVLKQGGTIICFYDLWKITTLKEYMEKADFKQLRFIEWIKSNPVPINSKVNYLTNSRETAIVGVKGSRPTFNSAYDKGIYEYPVYHGADRFHPTQKPVELISALIEKHSKRGDTVLDCFSGSGTTAVSCIETGRNFVGSESDNTYYQKSIDRINLKLEKVA